MKHTEETKKKISLSKKLNPTRYWLGKKMGPMPDWLRKKIGIAHKGKNTWTLGRKDSPETIEKKRAAALKNGNKPPVRYGPDNNKWKGGITEANQAFRTSSAYLKWRDSTFKRDDYTCQICKIRGVKLRANHIKRFADYKEMRLTPWNGITICESCDLKFVLNREKEWERYFYENLIRRNIIGEPFGWELFIDAYGCNPKVVDDIETVYKFLEDGVKTLGVSVQAPPSVFHSPEKGPNGEDWRDKRGISSWVPLIESSIVVHTLAINNFITIDYYTCSKFDNKSEKKLLELANETFGPKRIDSSIMLRGLDYYK